MIKSKRKIDERAGPCVDVGQRKLVDEMGVRGVLAGLFFFFSFFFDCR